MNFRRIPGIAELLWICEWSPLLSRALCGEWSQGLTKQQGCDTKRDETAQSECPSLGLIECTVIGRDYRYHRSLHRTNLCFATKANVTQCEGAESSYVCKVLNQAAEQENRPELTINHLPNGLWMLFPFTHACTGALSHRRCRQSLSQTVHET